MQANADQLRLLTDAAPIGIFQTDAEHRYVYTNPRWSEITGIAAEAAGGRSWDVIIDADAAPSAAAGDDDTPTRVQPPIRDPASGRDAAHRDR